MSKETLGAYNSNRQATSDANGWLAFLDEYNNISNKEAEEPPLLPIELKPMQNVSIESIEKQLTNPNFYQDEPEYPAQKIKRVDKIDNSIKSDNLNKIKDIISYVGINGLGIAISVLTKDLAPITITSSLTYFAIKKNKKLYKESINEMVKRYLDRGNEK